MLLPKLITMSRLLKIYTSTETSVFKLRATLYLHGVSSITKSEPRTVSYQEFRNTDEPILGLYIDSDQEAEAMALMKDFNKRLA
jgi:hypothetical protein